MISSECYPITVLPQMSTIYVDYLAMADSASDAPVRRWFGAEPFGGKWVGKAAPVKNSRALADLLDGQGLKKALGGVAERLGRRSTFLEWIHA